MGWESILLWIEQHPGLASWVQAVGSVIALVFAVWLPAHARATDRKKAVDGRKALFIVLLADLEQAIVSNGPADPAALVEALSSSLQKLDVFLASETNLEIAREVMAIRPEIKRLLKLAGTGYLSTFWEPHIEDPLRLIRELTVRIVESSPGILPKPIC